MKINTTHITRIQYCNCWHEVQRGSLNLDLETDESGITVTRIYFTEKACDGQDPDPALHMYGLAPTSINAVAVRNPKLPDPERIIRNPKGT